MSLISTHSISRNPNLSAPAIDRSSKNEVLDFFTDSQGQQNWWTGLHPEQCPGFNKTTNTLHALPFLNLHLCTRQDVMDYFNNTWTLTEVLFSGIKHFSTYIRPPYHQLRHPKLFYYGHTAVLFVNKLRLAGLIQHPVDLYLEKVLETGVDEMSWDDMSKNEMIWPSVEQVHAYKKKIYSIVTDIIKTHPDLDLEHRKNKNILLNPDHPLWALFMGFEHEKIHFETSSVLIRELPIDLVETPKYWPELIEDNRAISSAPKNSWVKFNEQTIKYGKDKNHPTFGWDNEYGQRETHVDSFEVTQNLITNAEFYQFVKSGDYSNDIFWSDEGLLWRKFRNTKRPTFWVAYGPEGLHDYKLRTIFEIINMPWTWPAEVNFHEAKAFMKWKNAQDKSSLHYRLITEPEFKTITQNLFHQDPVVLGSKKNELPQFNYNFTHATATPVDLYPLFNNIRDAMGNVWQWAEDQFNPLAGFKTHPLYDDFSTPCFDGKHQMILGGSFISCGHEASQTARFHFRPHFFQHAGFRLARTLNGTDDNQSTKINTTKVYIHQTRKNLLSQLDNTENLYSLEQPLELSEKYIAHHYDELGQFLSHYYRQISEGSPMGEALDPDTVHVKADYQFPYQATKNFPEHGEEFSKIMDIIKNDIMPAGQKLGHKGYMAYVSGSPNPITPLATALALSINPFTGHHSLAPGFVHLEKEALRWFIDLFKFPLKSAVGLFTSGGSQANMIAMVAARNNHLKNKDIHSARFYMSDQTHHSVSKSLAFLGFPEDCIRLIKSDDSYKIKIPELELAITEDIKNGEQPVCIIGNAGTTNTGSIDDLKKLAEISKKHDIWFHIDGAYGALFALAQNGSEILSGMELADSLTFDPHKALQIPYGVGGLIVKNSVTLKYDYKSQKSYMPPSTEHSETEWDFSDFSPELSRDPRGLRVWFPIKYYGIAPFKLNIEEKLILTTKLYTELKKINGLADVTKPDLSVIAFRLDSNEATKKIMAAINKTHQFYLTGCQLKGHDYVRICLLGYRTHVQDVELLTKTIETLVKEFK